MVKEIACLVFLIVAGFCIGVFFDKKVEGTLRQDCEKNGGLLFKTDKSYICVDKSLRKQN